MYRCRPECGRCHHYPRCPARRLPARQARRPSPKASHAAPAALILTRGQRRRQRRARHQAIGRSHRSRHLPARHRRETRRERPLGPVHHPFGDIDEQIATEAENRGADLIVMATHGRNGLSRLFSASVAEEVLHHTTRPIMFIRADDDATTPAAPLPTGARVLVPLDGTPFSEAALEPALELARLLEGSVVLLSVITPPPPPAMSELGFAAAAYIDFDLEAARRASQDHLARVAQQHGIAPAQAQATVQFGGTADGITEAIDNLGVSVVVMATHARSGLGHLISGSAATDTLHIHVPLVLLRSEDDADLAGSDQIIETVPSRPPDRNRRQRRLTHQHPGTSRRGEPSSPRPYAL
ncbi:MAG: universal stress protein [Thermomicrobiales bacterium]